MREQLKAPRVPVHLAVVRLKFAANAFNTVATGAEDLQADMEVSDGEIAAVEEFGSLHADWEHRLLLTAGARPGGLLDDAVWDRCCDTVLENLANGASDAVLLALHGAARTVRRASPELDLIRSVRGVIGERPLGVVLDHRANISSDLPALVDIALGARTWSRRCGPHAVTHTVLDELSRRLSGSARLQGALARTPYTLAAAATDAAAESLDRLIAESTGHASIFTGFPYSDVAEACACVLAWSPTRDEAREAARDIGTRLVAMRGEFRLGLPGPHIALRQALAELEGNGGAMVAITDPADAPEYGGSGDTTNLLRALLEVRPAMPAGIGFFADPQSVDSAFRAGAGSSVEVSLGARYSRDFGAAISVRASVERLNQDGGAFGRTAVLSVGDTRIAITERTSIVATPIDLERLGLDVGGLRLLILKAGIRLSPAMAALAHRIIPCDAAGPAALDIASLPLQNLRAR